MKITFEDNEDEITSILERCGVEFTLDYETETISIYFKSTPTIKSGKLNKQDVSILINYLKEIEKSLN